MNKPADEKPPDKGAAAPDTSEAPPQSGDEACPPGETSSSKAIDQIHSAAKWLVATFGAVAGALIAGLSLKDLGQLSGDNKTLAAFGVACGMAGVIVVIGAASAVLTSGRIYTSDLRGKDPRKASIRKRLDEMPELFGGFGSISKLLQAVAEAYERQITAFRQYYEKDDDTAAARYEKENEALGTLALLQSNVLSTANYEDVRSTFSKARWGIIGGALLSAVGIALFAYSSSLPAEEADTAVPEKPVAVIVDLKDDAADDLASTLGPECDSNELEALATETNDDSVSVITMPQDGCRMEVLKLSEGQATVRPLSRVVIPSVFQ